MGKEASLYDLFDTSPVQPVLGEQNVAESLVEAPLPRRIDADGTIDLYRIDFSNEFEFAPPMEKLSHAESRAMLATMAVTESLEGQVPKVEEIVAFPESVIKRFEEVMSFLTTQDKHVKFSLNDMLRITQQMGRLSHQERWYFKEYCKKQHTLEYFGENMFGLAERITPDTYWPGTIDISPELDIDGLLASTFDIMSHSDMHRRQFALSNVLGIIKSQGIELYTDELNEFMAQLAAYPGVMPQEDGTFFVQRVVEKSELTKDDLVKPVVARDRKYRVSGQKDVSTAIQKINRTDELKRAKDLAKNKANSRRRGRGRNRKSKGGKMKSRYQGKKKSFEQILAESVQNAPKPIE